MLRTVEATIDEHGQMRLKEEVPLVGPTRALVTIPEDSWTDLAEGWSGPEADEASKHLEELPGLVNDEPRGDRLVRQRRRGEGELMPTVLRIGPYRFMFFSSDQTEPPHVHVKRDNHQAKFWIEPGVRLEVNYGYAEHELNVVTQLVRVHRAYLLERWNGFFGG